MNRTDEISAVARDIAEQITPAPEQRDVIANNLVKLVCLVVQGVGKSVAGAGEGDLNDAHGAEFFLDTGADVGDESQQRAEFEREKELDCAKAHGMYITGERIQDGARWVQEEAVTADLDRWPDGQGWTSKLPAAPDRDGGPLTPHPPMPVMELPEGCVCVPVPVHDAAGSFLGFERCKHQRAAVAASFPPVPVPGEVFTSVPVGPFAPGELTQLAHQAADDMREQHKAPVPDEVWSCTGGQPSVHQLFGHNPGCKQLGPKPCDAQDCLAHGDAGRVGPCVRDEPVAARVVLHVWVTATDGDTGATLDYVHCGVCGVRKCNGGCGDATVGAAPDVDCTTHGNDQARQCNGSAVTCGWLPGDATTACDWDPACPTHGSGRPDEDDAARNV